MSESIPNSNPKPDTTSLAFMAEVAMLLQKASPEVKQQVREMVLRARGEAAR